MPDTHKDVEYHVEASGSRVQVFKLYSEAATFAFTVASSRGYANLDVVIWSKAGARFYGGDDAVEQYEEDPEVSVFDRFEIKVNNVGRVR